MADDKKLRPEVQNNDEDGKNQSVGIVMSLQIADEFIKELYKLETAFIKMGVPELTVRNSLLAKSTAMAETVRDQIAAARRGTRQ